MSRMKGIWKRKTKKTKKRKTKKRKTKKRDRMQKHNKLKMKVINKENNRWINKTDQNN